MYTQCTLFVFEFVHHSLRLLKLFIVDSNNKTNNTIFSSSLEHRKHFCSMDQNVPYIFYSMNKFYKSKWFFFKIFVSLSSYLTPVLDEFVHIPFLLFRHFFCILVHIRALVEFREEFLVIRKFGRF